MPLSDVRIASGRESDIEAPFEFDEVVFVILVNANDGITGKAEKENVAPAESLDAVPLKLVSCSEGLPCEWLESAAVVSPL